MTDIAPAEAEPTALAHTPEPAAAEPPPAAVESEAGAKAHGFESVDDAVAELTKVRSEAANRRVALKPYEEAFKGFDDDSRTTYLTLAQQIASGDPEQQKAAAARFREIAERIDGSEVGTKPTGEPDPDLQPLTRKELREIQEAAAQEQQIEAGIKQIEAEAVAAGIPLESPRYASYLWALQQPDVAGDSEKALALIKADEQSIVDGYAKRVAEGADKWPSVAPAGAAPSDEAEAPKSWKDAGRRAAAFVAGREGTAST